MGERSPKFKLSFTLPILTAIVLGGCAVVGSAPTFDETAGFLGCQSTLGSYSLPKTIIKIQITKDPDEPYHVLQQLDPGRVPDNQHTFCLDHWRSALASDQIRVFKNKINASEKGEEKTADGVVIRNVRKLTSVTQESTPYLQLIASKAVDHTAGIIRRVIRAAFILISNKGNFTPASRSVVGTKLPKGTAIVVADFQVDPFDYQEMALVNQAVHKLGFCFVLEDYTFDRSEMAADRYCRAPLRAAKDKPPPSAEAIRNLHYLVAKPVDGIYFRPRAAYRLSVYVKDDPGGPGAWRLGRIRNVDMENIMPIVSVGVDRAIFATRRTGLIFDDGTLTNVCISKGSELEGAIQIPLDVIYGIIALPSETIRGAITDATTAKGLLTAQKNLVDAQQQYIKFLNKDSGIKASSLPGPGAAKGDLHLGAVPTSPALLNDVPPDADPIFDDDATKADALAEICAELAVAKTRDPPTTVNGTPVSGKF